MADFNVAKHVHVEATVIATIVTLLTYGVIRFAGWSFPGRIGGFLVFLIIFAGAYVILYIVLMIVWAKR
jgi:hypothetical protein